MCAIIKKGENVTGSSNSFSKKSFGDDTPRGAQATFQERRTCTVISLKPDPSEEAKKKLNPQREQYCDLERFWRDMEFSHKKALQKYMEEHATGEEKSLGIHGFWMKRGLAHDLGDFFTDYLKVHWSGVNIFDNGDEYVIKGELTQDEDAYLEEDYFTLLPQRR